MCAHGFVFEVISFSFLTKKSLYTNPDGKSGPWSMAEFKTQSGIHNLNQ